VGENLNVDCYFAHPYHLREKEFNGNLNRLIRPYFAKSSDFISITEQIIKHVDTEINSRPRKRYNYVNPIFVMEQLLFNHNIAFVT
jgi:IS30 family transposase